MTKKKIIPAILSLLFIIVSVFAVVGFSNPTTKKASAATDENIYRESYETWWTMEYQGQNCMYAAWGTPEHYKLMEWGVWSNELTWLGIENYQFIQGGGVHPGNNWGTMLVWVANRSGTITISGSSSDGNQLGFYKSTSAGSQTNSDGTRYAIYQQKVTGGDPIEILPLVFKLDSGSYSFSGGSKVIDVTKGDTLVFYIDCGEGNCNVDDGSRLNFKIAYNNFDSDPAMTDFDQSEDLSQYLKTGNAGLIAGYKPMAGSFQADKLFGSVSVDTEETTIIIRSTTSSAQGNNLAIIVAPIASTIVAIALGIVAIKYIKARRTKND